VGRKQIFLKAVREGRVHGICCHAQPLLLLLLLLLLPLQAQMTEADHLMPAAVTDWHDWHDR